MRARALLRGERTLTVIQSLGLVGLLCLLGSSLGLTLDYRGHLIDLKQTIYQRCLQRSIYDQANHDSVAADAELYQQLLDISEQAPKQTDPVLARLVIKQEQVIRSAQQRKAAAARAGVIGSCNTYK